MLLPAEWEEHSDHQFLCDITTTQLKSPSQLLYPLENKKTNAQYLFADRSCQFLLNLLIDLGFRRVLSVGTPRYISEHCYTFKQYFSLKTVQLTNDYIINDSPIRRGSLYFNWLGLSKHLVRSSFELIPEKTVAPLQITHTSDLSVPYRSDSGFLSLCFFV